MSKIKRNIISATKESDLSMDSKVALIPLDGDQVFLVLTKSQPPKNFRVAAGLKPDERLNNRQTTILTVQELLVSAKKRNFGFCVRNKQPYFFNSQYWLRMESEMLSNSLGVFAEKLGVDKYLARHYKYKEDLLKQFLSQVPIISPKSNKGKVLINVENGTIEITKEGYKLRAFDQNDFLTNKLEFKYDPTARAPLFLKYLNTVLPDESCRRVLAEFLAYCLTKTDMLKMEKSLILLGDGQNGKSTFMEIVIFLLGHHNVSSHSMDNLMNKNGYFLPSLADKLVNYSSELSGEINPDKFKQLTSGEPIHVREIFGTPFLMTNICKFIFNANVLPKNVEHTTAFYRRFVIIGFNVNIPEKEQDKTLVQKIVSQGELPGILNWALEGLTRLLNQEGFSPSDKIDQELAKYKAESDYVKIFMDESQYEKSFDRHISVKYLSMEYAEFCKEYRYKPLNHGNFTKRLRALDYRVEKRNTGLVIFIQKMPIYKEEPINNSQSII